MKTHWLYFSALALISSILVSCAVGGAAQTTIPNGTYLSNAGAGNDQLKLSSGTYVIVVNGATYVQGEYTSTGDQLTLTTSDVSARCATSLAPAQYRWTLKGDLLTLNMDKDSCEARATLLEQTWGKK